VYLSNLGSFLEVLFNQRGNIADLENGIKLQRAAIDLAPNDHPSRVTCLINISCAFWTRFNHLQALQDVEEAICHLSAAANSQAGRPIQRFKAARLWAHIASLTEHSSMLTAYECAITIMPLVAWLGLPMAGRHQHLVEIGGISRDAAAAAISLGQCDKALEWLEQGRSIVWTQILQLRTPVDELRDAQPDLAKRLVEVSRLLDQGAEQGSLSDGEGHLTHEQGRRYRALTAEWESLLEQVRSLPKFEDFLRPPNSVQLKKAPPRDGPVVVLNIAEKRCDGLALVPGLDNVMHIALPNITSMRVTELSRQLKDLLCSSGVRMRGERAAKKVDDEIDGGCCRQILAELWSGLVKPILDSLGFLV
jgi:hypothetical protein